jgi:hypothetical protein
MAAHVDLLPGNAPPWARLFGETIDPRRVLADRYEDVYFAGQVVPPQFLPWLIWQLGLGELTPYVPSLGQLIDEGVRWQRVRGTPAAINLALDWLGYSATLFEDAPRRAKWNRFQIELDRVRDADLPDLRQIEGVVSLSPPARSIFYRGFRAYDVRAAEASFNRLSRSLLSSHSGVRIEGGTAKWSFGRTYNAEQFLGEAPLTALGTWFEPVDDNDLWADADYLWADTDLLWAPTVVVARRRVIAASITARPVLIGFKRGDGSVIGYRRAVNRPVRLLAGGEYSIGASEYTVDAAAPDGVLIRARTGFGDGGASTASSMFVLFSAGLAPGVPIGSLWLTPSQVSGGIAMAGVPVSIPFGLTVRELCNVLLRF